MQKRRHLMAWLGFIAVTMLMYPGVWLGQNDFFFNDIVNLNLPQRQVAAEIWAGGEVPLWDRYAFGGQPLLSAIQAGVLYPLNTLFLWMHANTALNVSNLLHQVLAGGFMYMFLYGIWRRSLPAFVGGVIFMSSGFMAGHVIHTQMMNAVVWIPLILHFVEQLRQKTAELATLEIDSNRQRDNVTKGAGRYAIGLTISMTLQILAGHPQVMYYTAIIVVFYFLYVLFRQRAGRVRFLLMAASAFLLAAVISSIQLIPTAGLIKRSFREAVSYEFFSYLPMSVGWLASVLVPFRNGGGITHLVPTQENWWELTGYVGIIALALAVGAGVRYWKRDWHVPFFAGIALIGLFVALGDLTGASGILYHVPVANWFRVPARFILFFDIAVAALAARAILGLQQRSEEQAAASEPQIVGRKASAASAVFSTLISKYLAGIGLYLAVAGVFLAAVLLDFNRHTAALPDWVWLIPAAWLSVLVIILLVQKKWPAVMLPLLVAALVYDNVTYVRNLSVDLLPPVSESRIATAPGDPNVPQYIAMMQQDADRFRIASFYRNLGLNRAGRFHLEALNGYDSLYPEIYENRVDLGWSWSPVTRNRQIIDVLNAKYIIAHPDSGIGLTTPGIPTVSAAVPTDNTVASIRFRSQYNGPKNRAPLARVVITGADGTRETYQWGSEVKLASPKTIKNLQIDYTEWNGSLQIASVEFLDSSNQLLRGIGPLPVLAPPWKERYKDDKVTVFENTAAYPRYWLTDNPADPRVRDTNAQIRETDYKQRESTVEVNSNGGWLVVSQLYEPGWVAYVDGKRVAPEKIGLDLTGISVTGGTHELRLRYEPKEWTIGITVSAVGILILAGWILYTRRKRTW